MKECVCNPRCSCVGLRFLCSIRRISWAHVLFAFRLPLANNDTYKVATCIVMQRNVKKRSEVYAFFIKVGKVNILLLFLACFVSSWSFSCFSLFLLVCPVTFLFQSLFVSNVCFNVSLQHLRRYNNYNTLMGVLAGYDCLQLWFGY